MTPARACDQRKPRPRCGKEVLKRSFDRSSNVPFNERLPPLSGSGGPLENGAYRRGPPPLTAVDGGDPVGVEIRGNLAKARA
jgi:hypothetical protein